MFKRGRIDAKQISRVLRAYERIPVRYIDLDLPDALDLAVQHNIYAYDAYVIACARNQGWSIRLHPTHHSMSAESILILRAKRSWGSSAREENGLSEAVLGITSQLS